MRKITLAKFEPLAGQVAEDTLILVTSKIPEMTLLKDNMTFHEQQATDLVEALFNCLPQGTFDLVGIKFMEKKVSLYQGKADWSGGNILKENV